MKELIKHFNCDLENLTLHDLETKDLTKFIVGDTEEEKAKEFVDLVNDYLEYFYNIDLKAFASAEDMEDFSDGLTRAEFDLITLCIFSYISFKSNKCKNPKYEELILFVSEAITRATSEELLERATLPQICDFFYYESVMIKNLFLASLAAALVDLTKQEG